MRLGFDPLQGVKLWFNAEPGREVWYRAPMQQHWSLVASPSWIIGHYYIRDDNNAEVTKSICDAHDKEKAWLDYIKLKS